jgi:hypothetical protein
MKSLLRKSFFATALSIGLMAVAGPASAQTCDPKDPKCVPPPKGGTPCSPGFYKQHIDFWWNVYCNDVSTPTCSQLLTALTCKGADATCGRSAAAAYLNAQSGCTE